MKLLAELKDVDVGWEPKESKMTKKRLAARAVLLKNNKIALLNVTKHGYHKLPGGGIEGSEDIKEALFREVLEETGCKIRIIGTIGKIVEYRTHESTIQTSFCWLAEAVEEGTPEFDRGEKEAGFRLEWLPAEKSLELLEKDRPETYDGRFIARRDAIFIQAVKNRIRVKK